MKCEIICITDRSGSMTGLKADVIGGFNSFLADQKTVPGEARMTFAQFDDKYELVYEAKPLSEAPELTSATFTPRGSTALMDAIGQTMNVQGARIAKENWADKVIVCIITDGGENTSREFTQPQIKTMIEHAQKNEWSFIFLAANQDAFAVGAGYGISGATTANFVASGAGTAQAYASTSSMTRSIRSGTPL
jgi:Mg-chelatase subunit ChlD